MDKNTVSGPVAEVDRSGVIQSYEWWDNSGGCLPGTKLYIHPSPSRAEVLEEALSEIKSMVTGDVYPAWGNMWETTVARGRILDIIERALGEKL